MLHLIVPISPEGWDEQKQEFVAPRSQELNLEHSLVALSKWESKWKKPFLSKDEKTSEETIDYVKCMTIVADGETIDPEVYDHLTRENVEAIKNYIEDPMTATTFSREPGGKNSHEVVTSELIYYWMCAAQVPVEFQHWHLNRLLTLLRVCSAKNAPPKKMSQRDTMARYKALNEARRKEFNSKG